MSKQQYLLSGVASAMAFALFASSVASFAQASDRTAFIQKPEQRVTARQVAILLDRAHYNDQRLDESMSQVILQQYFDKLDPNRTLLLQSDVDEFISKYGKTYAAYLIRGDLTPGIEIFERFRTRSFEYFKAAKAHLATDIDLYTNKSIILDREKHHGFGAKGAT